MFLSILKATPASRICALGRREKRHNTASVDRRPTGPKRERRARRAAAAAPATVSSESASDPRHWPRRPFRGCREGPLRMTTCQPGDLPGRFVRASLHRAGCTDAVARRPRACRAGSAVSGRRATLDPERC
ncbi:cobalamin biosynthesis CbiD domain protein [Burkholderia thailandensis]|uniref:Cobalamin biosynthesis CbiD domain protein n=1 Tax=Burkholderia thailandensis TaxID=57975 RepID=A0AAW9D512_BURTH|nr:cobalamin biosynthesis CbiD domain protein [Burkholderia thailandensis]MDW9257109.1 cobalamin biosynthesis CbiD domain protein [Burkholderia thailandensis]